MEQPLPHDLHDFMAQIQYQMSAEYERISKRATQDPGTAGDEGEENWAELLRNWLPSNYSVVTKGRIIGHDGRCSGQIDVIVLKGTYPKALIGKKIYLAAGVAAAFECKNTLRANHIDKAVSTCVDLKGLYPIRKGTPYKELHSPITYGLLAHSHSWKGEHSTPELNISEKLWGADHQYVVHPRLGLDLICVADLCTWSSDKRMPLYFTDDKLDEIKRNLQDALEQEGYDQNESMNRFEKFKRDIHVGEAVTTYMRTPASGISGVRDTTPIGAFIAYITEKMAWEYPEMQGIALYYKNILLPAAQGRFERSWSPSAIFSEETLPRVEADDFVNGPWSEWRTIF